MYAVRPGLECPFHEDLDHPATWQDRLDDYAWYAEHVSFLTDVKLAFRLVRMVFSKESTAVRSNSGGGAFLGYDDRGNVMKVEQAVGGNTVSQTTYTYDDRDRMLTAVTKTGDGEATYSYTYDEQGNMIEQVKDDKPAKLYTRIVYRYDDRGYVQEEKSYDQEDVLLSSITYAYEADNTGRTATYYDGEGKTTGQVVTSRYDANGYLIQEITTVDGEVFQTIENTYEAMEIPVK
jgi:YD repeat-containing protein